jgi:NADPH:quinone reductase-like Zn-dependent oxidoreductase
MKAVVIDGFGGVDQLHIQNVDDPPVGRGEVLLRVRATSVNPVDLKIRNGSAAKRMGVELPAILGRDLAGEVVRAGDGVVRFSPGQRVMGLANGTYAELTTAKADVLAPIPDKLSFEQAAALPLVLLTGAQLIERAIKVQPGWTVLILGCRQRRQERGARRPATRRKGDRRRPRLADGRSAIAWRTTSHFYRR